MKIFYFDVETTGTDSTRHGIVQLACLIEIDGEERGRHVFNMRPFPDDVVDPQALEVNGLSLEQIQAYPDPRNIYLQLQQLLGVYIDKFDKADKFTPAGYNGNFDMDFLKRFFEKNNDRYFGSWFNYNLVDPLPVLRFFRPRNEWIRRLPDMKLVTVAKALGIPHDSAHDALSDILATREIIRRIHDRYSDLLENPPVEVHRS